MFVSLSAARALLLLLRSSGSSLLRIHTPRSSPCIPRIHHYTHSRTREKKIQKTKKQLPYIVLEKRKRAMAIATARNDEAENVVENDRLKTPPRRKAARADDAQRGEQSPSTRTRVGEAEGRDGKQSLKSTPRRSPRTRRDVDRAPALPLQAKKRSGSEHDNDTTSTTTIPRRRRKVSTKLPGSPRRRKSVLKATAPEHSLPRADLLHTTMTHAFWALTVIVFTCSICIFLPVMVCISFLGMVHYQVGRMCARAGCSAWTTLLARLVAPLPFFFVGPAVIVIAATLQILFSSYHSAATEFLLISASVPLVFTSPWWGSWWYISYLPLSLGLPFAVAAWSRHKRMFLFHWRTWGYGSDLRAKYVTLVNRTLRWTRDFFERHGGGDGKSFPITRNLSSRLRKLVLAD